MRRQIIFNKSVDDPQHPLFEAIFADENFRDFLTPRYHKAGLIANHLYLASIQLQDFTHFMNVSHNRN